MDIQFPNSHMIRTTTIVIKHYSIHIHMFWIKLAPLIGHLKCSEMRKKHYILQKKKKKKSPQACFPNELGLQISLRYLHVKADILTQVSTFTSQT